ncbi:unnamed protein product [Hydatigera taeniaeformis]|uniref:Anaphase-promoting complex subunit 1 n=1 Tax=Hydatigena taeniaeformis TaxID=6205 RepID=A0A0R3X722_HYDTA|nr:unnamed protein product [Hydatigera taeniaeformis]
MGENIAVSIRSYDLDEFVLISPADPEARRLVGTTRIRLLLSSIEMALSASACHRPLPIDTLKSDFLLTTYRLPKDDDVFVIYGFSCDRDFIAVQSTELPMLVSYGNDKLYYGLRLSRGGPVTDLSPSEIVVPDSGLKKIEYAIAHASLPHSEAHLAKLRDIFREKVGFSEETPNVSVLQYFRMVKLKFHCLSNDYADDKAQFVFSPEQVLSEVSLKILVKFTPIEWSADCVLGDVKHCLLDSAYHVIAQSLNTANSSSNADHLTREVLSSDLMQSVLNTSVTMSAVPAAYLSPELPSSEALDNQLICTLGCRYVGAAIRTLLIAFHLLILRTYPTDIITVVIGSWCVFLNHLRCSPVSESFLNPNVGEDFNALSPIDEALLILSKHPKPTSPSQSPSKVNEEEFFDAMEDQVVQHAVLPSALITWYCKKLKTLRDKVAKRTFDYQPLFQLVKDFHRRTLCAISLNTFFKYCDPAETLQPLVLELANRFHTWNTYQPSKLTKIEYFNVSKTMAFPLSPEIRSLFVQGLMGTFDNPPRIPFRVPVCLSEDSVGLPKAELAIHGANSEPFPVYRLVTITANRCLRRPNRKVSGPSQQRALFCICNTATTPEELDFIRRGQGDCSDLSIDGDHNGVCHLYLAGCFGEDCDIR